MFRRLFRLAIGIPLIAFGAFIALLALVGFLSGDDPTLNRSLAVFFSATSLILMVIGARACRKTTWPDESDSEASSPQGDSGESGMAWRHDKATDRQKHLARKLGIEFGSDISKGEISDLISDVKGGPRFQLSVAQRTMRRKQRAKDRLTVAKEEIRFMNQVNRECGDQGMYAGFKFSRNPDEKPSHEEEQYIGTFLPIQVASKYPHLLAVETIGYEDVTFDQRLKRGIKMVVKPGKFKTL